MSKKSSKQPANSLEQQRQKQLQQQQQQRQGSADISKSNLKNQSSHISSEQSFGAKLGKQQTHQAASKRKQAVVAATTQTPQTLVNNHRTSSSSKGFNQKRSKMQPQQTQPDMLEQSNQEHLGHHHHDNHAQGATMTTSSKLDTKSTTLTTNNKGQPASDNICAACLKPIRERYLLVALDKQWHEDCLKCACCDCRLGEVGSSLFTHADKILCRRDFLRIFGQAGNCAACKKSIPPYELVMRANENAYHMECFACQQCQYRFCVGDRFHLNEAHRIVCILCHNEQQQQHGQQSQASHSTSYHTSPVDVQLVGATMSEQTFHFGSSNETSGSQTSPRQAGGQQQQQQQQQQLGKEDLHGSPGQQAQMKQQQEPAATCAM